MTEKSDATRPNYYKVSIHTTAGVEEIECFDVIEALRFGFNLGNVLKYIWRAGAKSPDVVEDLKKARVYLDREIALRGGER